MTLKAVDVTDQEVLSSLKRDLIDKESVVSSARFASLQAKLRTLFRRPSLQVGLAAVQGDRVLVLNDAMSHDHADIYAHSAHHKTSEFKGSLYERAVIQNRPIIIDDLAAWPDRTSWEDELIAAGARTFVCAPLQYQDKAIGTLELISPKPGDLNATHLPKLDEVLPLFSMAVQRSVEELDARVQAMIKEKCTNIHPVVEWRFRKAVFNAIERKGESVSDAAAEMEPIAFKDVYPLYGLADIRGASAQRGVAIQADLLTQLRLAADVLRAAHEVRMRRVAPGEIGDDVCRPARHLLLFHQAAVATLRSRILRARAPTRVARDHHATAELRDGWGDIKYQAIGTEETQDHSTAEPVAMIDLVGVGKKPGDTTEQVEERQMRLPQQCGNRADVPLAQLALVGRDVLGHGHAVTQPLQRRRECDRFHDDGQAARLQRCDQRRHHHGVDVVQCRVAHQHVESTRFER